METASQFMTVPTAHGFMRIRRDAVAAYGHRSANKEETDVLLQGCTEWLTVLMSAGDFEGRLTGLPFPTNRK